LASFYCHAHAPDLPSFPTRRSSDLAKGFDRAPRAAMSAALLVRATSPPPAAGSGAPPLGGGRGRGPARGGEAASDSDPWSGLVADRKSTRLNSSHSQISYAVFCLKK